MIKYNIVNKYSGSDCAVLPVGGDKMLDKFGKELDEKLAGLISKMLGAEDFNGEKLQMSFSRTADKEAPAVFLIGMGKPGSASLRQGKLNDFDVRVWKQAIGAAVITLQSKKMKKLSLVVPARAFKKISAQTLGLETSAAVEIANYSFDEYKSDKKSRVAPIQEVCLIGDFAGGKKNSLQKGIKKGQVIGESVNYTRCLGNTPPGIMTPALLASEAVKLSKLSAKLKVKVLSLPEIKKLGMGCLLGVSRGSAEEPKFIILEYFGLPKSVKPTVLVGKGITFDSGGLGLKPSNVMNDMKFDMLGAATVLGSIRAAAALGLKKNLVGLIPACENMPSGTAYRPDDILTAYNGKTVEITHTDAEGRLILADALAYADKYKPKEVIDFATLTGACMVALGNERSGLFGNDEKIIEKLKNKSEEAREQLWHLPLGEEYSEAMKSEVADIKNTGHVGASGLGGASTAAAFLQFFTNYPWAHIDLSSSYYGGKGKPWIRAGANGFGVQTMINYLG